MLLYLGFYPIEKTLVLNDGFTRTVDLIEISQGYQQYIYWLNDILLSFAILNNVDKKGAFLEQERC